MTYYRWRGRRDDIVNENAKSVTFDFLLKTDWGKQIEEKEGVASRSVLICPSSALTLTAIADQTNYRII